MRPVYLLLVLIGCAHPPQPTPKAGRLLQVLHYSLGVDSTWQKPERDQYFYDDNGDLDSIAYGTGGIEAVGNFIDVPTGLRFAFSDSSRVPGITIRRPLRYTQTTTGPRSTYVDSIASGRIFIRREFRGDTLVFVTRSFYDIIGKRLTKVERLNGQGKPLITLRYEIELDSLGRRSRFVLRSDDYLLHQEDYRYNADGTITEIAALGEPFDGDTPSRSLTKVHGWQPHFRLSSFDQHVLLYPFMFKFIRHGEYTRGDVYLWEAGEWKFSHRETRTFDSAGRLTEWIRTPSDKRRWYKTERWKWAYHADGSIAEELQSLHSSDSVRDEGLPFKRWWDRFYDSLGRLAMEYEYWDYGHPRCSRRSWFDYGDSVSARWMSHDVLSGYQR